MESKSSREPKAKRGSVSGGPHERQLINVTAEVLATHANLFRSGSLSLVQFEERPGVSMEQVEQNEREDTA